MKTTKANKSKMPKVKPMTRRQMELELYVLKMTIRIANSYIEKSLKERKLKHTAYAGIILQGVMPKGARL